jgi:hypothetical protein
VRLSPTSRFQKNSVSQKINARRVIMSEKFDSVPVDEDTRIRFRQKIRMGEFDVLYEKWSWEGILAESIIFADDDISGMTDEEIEQEARKSPAVKNGSEIKIKRSDAGFTFVNFNFELT